MATPSAAGYRKSLPSGGTAGQVLAKVTDESFDIDWITPEGSQGPEGPEGPQGPQGETGLTGAQGEQGPQGDTGANGAQGEQGIQGIQGIKGDTGDTGPEGPEGPEGPQGPQGVQGEPGGGSSWEFPMGWLQISTVDVNPATFLGYGTWQSFGAGRVLVGLDSGDSDFDVAEETGGVKAVTLTGAQSGIAQHTHTQNAHNHTQDAHAHEQTAPTSASGGAVRFATDTNASGADTAGNNATQSATATNQAATAVNQNAGPTSAAEAHINLQPYIVVYMWKRTA